MDFHILHFPKTGTKNTVNLNSLGFVTFETCLRQIAFFNSDSFMQKLQKNSYVEIHKADKAFQFVLEVICGLHSLIKGETEIFGQFKEFASTQKNAIEMLGMTELFKQLLTDCKSLRSSRIQHWSHNTYGSVTRKLLNQKDGVMLLGSGHLAQEIAPWLKHVKTKSVLLRRSKELGAEFSNFRIESIQNVSESPNITVLVVAAAVSNVELETYVNMWPNLRLIIDWRGDEQWVTKNNETVFHLHDLKENDERTKEEQSKRIQLVSEDIQMKALVFSKKAKHNPWGWEDFCA
jgi:glutamyl-tRNA reductase